MTDEWCATLGCEGDPVDGEVYCRECIETSPGLVDDPDTVGETVNPAGGASGGVKSTGSPDTSENEPRASGSEAREPRTESGEMAFADAVEWFHGQLDSGIADHTEAGEHPDRPTTPRDYFHEVRGWTDATLDDALLGYAPASRTGLLDHLMREGYGREAILGTGLFTEDLRPLWQGRYVLPYFDEDGQPVYAISRSTGDKGGGAVGYDGHPDDGMSGKYAKPAHSKEYADVEEPIFGLGSVEDGQPVIITEGIADAITAHQSGYPCVSPVTTRFKHDDRERLVEVLDAHDVPRAYVVGDAERAGSDLDEEDRLTLQQGGEGLRGALDTAAHLARNDADALVAELPRSGLGKVDLDGYLREWSTTLDPVLASAKPAREHPDHDPQNAAIEAARTARDRAAPEADGDTGDHSALFDLDLRDVADVGEGYRGVNPLGHHGESENYAVSVGDGRDGVLYDHKHKAAYNALTFLLVEAGERRANSPNGRLDDGEVLAAWVHAKGEGLIPDDDPIPHRALRHVALDGRLCERDDVEDGWKLPAETYNSALDAVSEEYGLDPGRRPISDGGTASEPVAMLPNSPRAQAAANGWDWMSADRAGVDDALTIDDARERTRGAIGDAYERADRVLVEALPTLGKSYGAIAAAADTGEPITLLTTRGNKEQYEQLREWCEEHGLRAKVMPSFLRDCETANGEHGEAAKDTVREWYHRGATGKDIHVHYENETGQPIPCDGPAGARCSYKAGWQFDADEYDVLIGHYLHGHVKSASSGRTVVFDEFPGGAFETALDGARLAGAVTRYLKTTGTIPFEDYADLLAHRDDADRRADALAHFESTDPERDGEQAFTTDGHALAPLAAYTILAGAENDLGNGWERATLPENGVGLFDRENARIHLLQPPDLDYTRGTVALDGTPTRRMWELALGTRRLNHRQVLSDGERVEYVRDTLSLNLVRTTEYVKSYNSEDHINPENDAALLDAVADEHGRAPALLTTMTGQRTHENAGLYETDGDGELVDGKGRTSALGHYGNVLGSNRFASERLGVVIGSNHYGDGFIEKWGAFAGQRVERDGDGKGADLSYTGVGDDVHRHMTDHQTLQAAMRFGRDGGGATVYVHTNTLPEWIEDGALAGEGRVLRTYSDGERQLIDALDSDAIGEEWTTTELADHPAVDVCARQVREHLHRLAERGYVDVDVEGNGFVWRDDGLHRLGEHGEVELAPVELDDLDDAESAELARSSNYTWNFRTSTPSGGDGDVASGDAVRPTVSGGRDAGDPPPDTLD